MVQRLVLVLAALLLCASPAWAQPEDPTFGMEFEFAGSGNRIVRFEEMPFENYREIMRVIVEHYNGRVSDVRKVTFTKPTSNLERYPSGERTLFKATWKDPRGRTWLIEPEFVASSGYDGYELVTPPMDDPRELEEILKKVRGSGLVREGRRSGVHLTVDGRNLITRNGDARALANLILMHENNLPTLRRMFNPIRGGGHENYFARDLGVDHHDLLEEINRLRPEERTRANLERMFRAREGREMALHEVDPMDPTTTVKPWKYRSLNLAKALNVNANHDGNAGLVEFRMFDMADPETHRLEAELYRRMVARAKEMADRGEAVRYTRRPTPAGEDPAVYNLSENPEEARAKAREMIEGLGLDPREYEPLLERNFQPREVRSEREFRGMLDALPRTPVTHNGEAFTYGFELEGRGEGLVNIARPTDAATNSRWDSMSEGERKAYFREVVGENHSSVERHFKLDTEKHKWLDPYWYVEGTGNWEIHSRVMKGVGEITDAMREAKRLTGASGKGFHLHMRDNKPDWRLLEARGSEYADFMERASNWIYLKRVERLRTDLSLKSWSNARLSPDEIHNISELGETDRATLRIADVRRGGSNEYIDMEIRGFTKYVDDIETLAKIFTNNMKTGEFGTWRHTDNVMPTGSNWGYGNFPSELSYVENFERYMREVEGTELSPERRKIIEGLQDSFARRARGDMRAYSTGVATPLLPWETEGSLSEVDRRAARFAKEEYLGWLKRYSDRIMSGEFGVDLSLANKTALTEKLGLSEAEADALLEYRRSTGGKLSPEAAARVLALRSGSEADMRKIARAERLDMTTASANALRERLGISAAEAKRILAYRDAHGVEESLTRAGLRPAARRGLAESARSLDLTNPDVTAETLAGRGGITGDLANRVIAYRDAHEVTSEEALRSAGLDAEEARDLLGRNAPGVDPTRMSAAELAEALGISEAKAEAMVRAREANPLRRWSEVTGNAGLTEAALRKLRAKFSSLSAMNSAGRDALLEAGLTPNQVDKLLAYRDASDLRSREVLRTVLGNAVGDRAHSRVAGFDLARMSVDDMRRAGVDYELAERIVNYRDAHRIGRPTEVTPFNAERAADELYERDVISWEEARKLRAATEAVDLATANKSTLTGRLGMSADAAAAFLAHRDAHKVDANALKRAGFSAEEARKLAALAKEINLKNARIADIMARTGLSRAKAEKLKALAKLDYSRATLDKLVEAGIPRAKAERLLGFRDSAKAAGGLDYNEIVRKLRLRVRKWVRDSGLADSLLRSLLPRERSRVNVTRNVEGEGERFARVRRAAEGSFTPSRVSYGLVGNVFDAVRTGALVRSEERLRAATTETERANLDVGRAALNGLEVEIVETNDILADRNGERIRVSTGLLNEIDARAAALPPAERGGFRTRVLGLIMGHEAAHAGGLRSEKLADAEALKILERARMVGTGGVDVAVTPREVRAAVDAFARPTGATHVDGFFARLRDMFRYGTTGRRVADLEAAARGEEVDRFARWRRADGTLDWKRMTRDGALREGAGAAHFALALFLKELAMVVRTGDRMRIEEFFDGLMTTDFYTHYGMFVIGARAGEVAYVRYLQRHIKPRFVNGILKSNLVLAAGLALPEIVNGTFTGKAFAISLTSLGLASTAVKTGLSGIKWVVDLKKAKKAGTLARTGLAAGRLAKFGAWFYTAAELAVILFIAEDIEHGINSWLDEREAHKALAASSNEFFAAVGDPGATPESVKDAAEAYREAWANYRDFLYRPLHEDEALFAHRLEKVARDAKLAADKREVALDRVRNHASLRASIERRHGSLEGYADHLAAEDERELEEEVNKIADSYNRSRDAHLSEVYEGNRRGTGLLDGVDNLSWLVLGGREGAPNDPWEGSNSVFARIGRNRSKAALESAIEDSSGNRLESYSDERAILSATMDALSETGRDDLAHALTESHRLVGLIEEADRRLFNGEGMVDVMGSSGLSGIDARIDEAGDGRRAPAEPTEPEGDPEEELPSDEEPALEDQLPEEE